MFIQKAEIQAQHKRAANILIPATEICLFLKSNEKEKKLIDTSQKIDEKEKWATNLILKYFENFYSLNNRDYIQDS